jgi:hypothetical protein
MARSWQVSALIALTVTLTACGGGYAGDSAKQARYLATAQMRGTPWVFVHLAKGHDNLTRKAWVAVFKGAAPGLHCDVYVRNDQAAPSPHCFPANGIASSSVT